MIRARRLELSIEQVRRNRVAGPHAQIRRQAPAAGAELAADLTRAATLDVHAADQLIIYCALARGESWFTTRALSSHARAAIWLIRQFLRAEFHEDEDPAGVRVTIRSEGTR